MKEEPKEATSIPSEMEDKIESSLSKIEKKLDHINDLFIKINHKIDHIEYDQKHIKRSIRELESRLDRWDVDFQDYAGNVSYDDSLEQESYPIPGVPMTLTPEPGDFCAQYDNWRQVNARRARSASRPRRKW